MNLPEFTLQPDEQLLCQVRPPRTWIAVALKVAGSLVTIVIIFLASALMFLYPFTGLLKSFLPADLAGLLAQGICLGLIPLLAIAVTSEDTARIFTGELVLTDRRLWVRGSPYAWSVVELPVEDIAAMTWQRHALFVRQRSNHKMHVHMLAGGQEIAKTWETRISQ